jgi:heme-degrading monooxygenase HmoA
VGEKHGSAENLGCRILPDHREKILNQPWRQTMIVRMWRGKVRKDLKSEYVAYLNQTGLADYGKVEGNQGAYLLCRDMDDNVEFLTMTFWTSITAVRKFAGDDYEKARYYPEDEKFLLNFAENAEHFEVLYDGAKDSKN